MFSLGNICSIIAIPFASSISSFLWQIFYALWPWYWFVIIALLFLWIVGEILTRNGTVHYNSENGFSPSFNRFVGSGTYTSLQALLLLSLEKFFGDSVYCILWPYEAHLLVFISSGLLLHFSGFWPYLKEPSNSGRRYHKRKLYRR